MEKILSVLKVLGLCVAFGLLYSCCFMILSSLGIHQVFLSTFAVPAGLIFGLYYLNKKYLCNNN